MLIIAIDPGAAGGIAVQKDGELANVFSMPPTPRDIHDFLWELQNEHKKCRALIEKVGYHMPGNAAPATAKFARHCGHLEMALIALNIPFEAVLPQRWMKAFGAMPKEKTARKNHIKDQVQRVYPHLKVTLWAADALGILYYATKGT